MIEFKRTSLRITYTGAYVSLVGKFDGNTALELQKSVYLYFSETYLVLRLCLLFSSVAMESLESSLNI